MPKKVNKKLISFTDKVKNVVKNIKSGQTLSYKDVARKAGSPNAYRVVGSIMAKNYDKNIPCHRVIKSSGEVGNYNRGGEKAKYKILKKEGYLQNNK